MSTLDQIDHAVEVLGSDDLVLLHTTSTYPSPPHELNLRVIATLAERYRRAGRLLGARGRASTSTLAAVVLGACAIERHITLDRAMWGSRPGRVGRAAAASRAWSRTSARSRPRSATASSACYESEIAVMQKLRRVGL